MCFVIGLRIVEALFWMRIELMPKERLRVYLDNWISATLLLRDVVGLRVGTHL